MNNEINLIGDKGYITSEQIKYNNNNVKMITALKKNSKNKYIYELDIYISCLNHNLKTNKRLNKL